MHTTDEDLKTLRTTVKLLERAHFKELSSPQIMTAFLTFQGLGAMIKKMEEHLATVAKFGASSVPPPKKVTQKK